MDLTSDCYTRGSSQSAITMIWELLLAFVTRLYNVVYVAVGKRRKKRMRFTVRRYNSVPADADDNITRLSDEDATSSSRSETSSSSPLKCSPVRDGRSQGLSNKHGVELSRESSINNTYTKTDARDKLTSVNRYAKRGRSYASRHRTRLVKKEGECNISNMNVSAKRRQYLMDLFTTMLDMKWRYCILLFTLAFLISWLLFALIYYAICIIHGDHLHREDESWQPCHTNVHDFTTAFLFSLETQHTIGYGFRAMEPHCPPAIITLCAQSCIGVFFQCIVTGLVFAKLSRPKRRGQTIMFSEKAVICQRDGRLNLLFRVGDMRKSHFVGTTIRAVMVKNRLTKEGELIPLCIHPLALETESSGKAGDGFVFLIWPVVVTHHINEESPLWNVTAEQLVTARFEIVVILEGTVESSGMTTQVRTSYLPSEILWGHRPAPLLTYEKDQGGYSIDNKQFHATLPVSMPECSAMQLSQMTDDQRQRSEDEHVDFPINLTAPPAHFTPRRNGPSAGPLRRLRNSFKKNRRNSDVHLGNGSMKKASPSGSQASVHRGSVPHVNYTAPASAETTADPPSYDEAKTIKKCMSETEIVFPTADGRPRMDGSGDGPNTAMGGIKLSTAVS